MDFKKDPSGSYSAHSKLRTPNRSISLSVDSIAVGVEMNKIIMMAIVCKKNLLKINNPLCVPPTFFHIISIGSLARFIIST